LITTTTYKTAGKVIGRYNSFTLQGNFNLPSSTVKMNNHVEKLDQDKRKKAVKEQSIKRAQI